MPRHSKVAVHHLCETHQIEEHFFLACLDEAVVEVVEMEGELHFANATLLRLRRVQRLCVTFDVDVTVGLMLANLKADSAKTDTNL